MLRQLGCEIIDADLLAREVVEPGEPAYREIVAEFGPRVVRAAGGLDRAQLGAIVFADPARRRRLEEITHPRIRERFANRLHALAEAGFRGLVVFDAAVMIESGNYRNMDKLVVVITDDVTQRARLRGRDGASDAEAERRIASQMPLAEKAALADYVIDNTGSRADTEAQVRQVHAALLAELRARCPEPAR
jgi:dephospho-CoA kinase